MGEEMDWFTRRGPFAEAARAAFPPGCEGIACQAESDLELSVDDTYRTTSMRIIVEGSSIYVPYRLHFADGALTKINYLSPGAQCLLTRATNGYVRQEAAKAVVDLNYTWSIPFVVLLLGDYVTEVTEEIHCALDKVDRPAYTEFVLRNRVAMHTLRARATSYWSAYHRQSYPQRNSYPALAALTRLEDWAS
jgi:hypothetical protein